MDEILPFGSARMLPDLTVVEFVLLMALSRLGPSPAPVLVQALTKYFALPVGLSDIQPALRRLRQQQLVTDEVGGLPLASHGAARPVSLCYAATIRLIGEDCRVTLSGTDTRPVDIIRAGIGKSCKPQADETRTIIAADPHTDKEEDHDNEHGI